jgi:hypothetical protein
MEIIRLLMDSFLLIADLTTLHGKITAITDLHLDSLTAFRMLAIAWIFISPLLALIGILKAGRLQPILIYTDYSQHFR